MIMIRVYRALSEIVVEATAQVRHDAIGNPTELQTEFLGRQYCDGTTALCPTTISEQVYELLREAFDAINADGGDAQLIM